MDVSLHIPVDVLTENIVKAERIFSYEEHDDLPLYGQTFSSRDAHELQLRLLPTKPPKIDGFHFEAISFPAAIVGGDHFNFLSVGGDKLGILIFDVSGKGAEAALIAARLRSIFRMQTWGNRDVKNVMCRANDFLLEVLPPARFVTCIYGILDPRNLTFTFARAGHEPLLLCRDRKIETVAPIGLPLGIGTPFEFADLLEIRMLKLQRGDRLFFFTDGLTEARNRNSDEFGLERIACELEKSDGRDLARLRASITDWTQGFPPHDDLTMISLTVEENEL